MVKDHYIPASFLARFSVDANPVAREKRLWVASRSPSKTYSGRAERIAAITEYYTLLDPTLPGARIIDDIWSSYEKALGAAIEDLTDIAPPSCDASCWLRILVPFVAGMFVRGPHFERTQLDSSTLYSLSRQSENPDQYYRDNVNMSRNTAMQRALAPIMAATWTVLHAPVGATFVTTDLGYANYPRDTSDIVIPLGPSAALRLSPMPIDHSRKILFDLGEANWRTIVEHTHVSAKDVGVINAGVCRSAQSFIVCGSESDAADCMGFLRRNLDPVHVNLSVLTFPRMQKVHEFDWYKAVSLIAQPSSKLKADDFEVDWGEVAKGWHPIPMFPTNLPSFRGGLRHRGRSVSLYMTGVEGYTDSKDGSVPWDPITGHVRSAETSSE